jgi:hypothetical protein
MTSGQSGVTVDSAPVSGNATLLDGSTVATSGFSRLQMSNGASLGLGAGSRVQVFANRVSLESGVAEVQSSSNFEIDARTLKIVASDSGSIARVKLDGLSRVLVTAVNAPVNVLNQDGVLVARVTPSLPLSFLPQAAAAGTFEMTGCVVNKNGAAILVGSTGMYELRGANLKNAVGNSVHVKGTVSSSALSANATSQVVTVNSSELSAKGGCTSALALAGAGATLNPDGLGAASTAGAAPVAGAASGTTAAVSTTVIVVGVVVGTGAIIGGLAAAGTFTNASN